MCIICLDLDKLTINEAVRNLFETKSALEPDHLKEVLMNIYLKAVKENADAVLNPALVLGSKELM